MTAAQKSKIEKQLEALTTAKKLLNELLTNGFDSLSKYSDLEKFEEVARELSSYIPGIQISFLRITRNIYYEKFKNATQEIVKLNSVIKKAEIFLNKTLQNDTDESENVQTDEENYLFEALGGVWKLNNLDKINCYEENARLIQLSFDLNDDEVKEEFVDRGFYFDLNTNEIYQTKNFRPYRANLTEENSFYEVYEIPKMYKYPGVGCKRIRWGKTNEKITPVLESDYQKILSAVEVDIPSALKKVKNEIKGTLSPKWFPVLLPVGKILVKDDSIALCDKNGNSIFLSNYNLILGTSIKNNKLAIPIENLKSLPVQIKDGDAIFGLVFYDVEDKTLKLNPLSYINEKNIIRLAF